MKSIDVQEIGTERKMNRAHKCNFRPRYRKGMIKITTKTVKFRKLSLEPTNPMIADALEKGEDATGLCTLRDLVEEMLASDQSLVRHWHKCEIAWQREDRSTVNVEVRITGMRWFDPAGEGVSDD